MAVPEPDTSLCPPETADAGCVVSIVSTGVLVKGICITALGANQDGLLESTTRSEPLQHTTSQCEGLAKRGRYCVLPESAPRQEAL